MYLAQCSQVMLVLPQNIMLHCAVHELKVAKCATNVLCAVEASDPLLVAAQPVLLVTSVHTWSNQ